MIMAGYTGQYDCKIDAKGRLKLPAGLLRQLSENQSGKFVVNKGLDNNLDLYTEEEWDKITSKMGNLTRLNSKYRKFLRAFYKHAVPVESDSSNRILIHKKLSDLIQLESEAVIMCYGSTIEIWSKDIYEAENEEIENFSEMADDIFNDLNIDL